MALKKVKPQIKFEAEKLSLVLRNSYIGLIIFAYLFQFGLNPEGVLFGDSVAYGAGDSRNWNLISISGNSLRNWPLVLTNVTLGNSTLQTLSQFIVAAFVWSGLIWNTQRFLKTKHFYLSSSLVTILAISPYVVSWNSVLLGESYGLSFLVLTITTCLRWSFMKNKRAAMYFILSLLSWSSLQSRNFLALCALCIIFLPLVALLKKKWFNRQTILMVTIFALLFSYLGVISYNQQNQDYDVAISYRALSNLYTFAAHSQADVIKSELKKQPGFECMGIDSMTDVIAISRKLVDTCPAALSWIEDEYFSWYTKFLISHPVYTSRLLLEGLAASNNPSEFYAGTLSIAPTLFNGLFFGSRNYSFGSFENVSNKMVLIENDKQQFVVISKGETKSYNAVKANAPIFLWIFLALFLLTFRIRNMMARKSWLIDSEFEPMFIILVLSILGFGINLLVCPAEYFKLTIQYSVALFLSVILITAKIENINQFFHVKNEN